MVAQNQSVWQLTEPSIIQAEFRYPPCQITHWLMTYIYSTYNAARLYCYFSGTLPTCHFQVLTNHFQWCGGVFKSNIANMPTISTCSSCFMLLHILQRNQWNWLFRSYSPLEVSHPDALICSGRSPNIMVANDITYTPTSSTAPPPNSGLSRRDVSPFLNPKFAWTSFTSPIRSVHISCLNSTTAGKNLVHTPCVEQQ